MSQSAHFLNTVVCYLFILLYVQENCTHGGLNLNLKAWYISQG